MQEEYYPRGGTRSKPIQNNSSHKSENLFGTLHRPKKEKRPRRDRNENLQINRDASLHSTSADLLSYEKILPGMVILGCVRDISSYAIQVELPGRTFARIEINAISNALSTNLLEKAKTLDEDFIEENVLNILSKVFTQRQFLPILILDVSRNVDSSKRVMGSVNPKQINGNLTYKALKKGMLVWGCVAEKSDYVYIIDLGIKNTRTVLPFRKDVIENYIVGQTMWFVIKDLQILDKTATITVGIKQEDVVKAVETDSHLDHLLPGTCVQCIITKTLRNGLECTYFDDYVGYINETYLNTPMDQLNQYKDSALNAYVLYVHPTTKFTYLTLRNPHLTSEINILPKGYIGQAKIVQRIGKGLIVKLNKNELGFVTYKRLIRAAKLRDTSDLTETVKRKFPIGSTHNCRVLDYIHMDRMYICTFESNILKEEVFSKSDLKLGQLVKGKIEEINKSGVAVKIGKITGFATNEHLNNVQYSDNLKKNYHIGDSVQARVWDINGNSVKLTLKQAFVREDKCLTGYESAKRNEQFLGMVVKTYKQGALVCFYGGVKGWLKLKSSQGDCTNMFYQGQVITVTVLSSDGTKLILTLDPPEKNNKKIQLGQVVNGIVESINSNGIFVRTVFGEQQGFIPVNHLSSDCKLSQIMLNLYNCGEQISNLICIENIKKKTLSLREYNYYSSNKFFIPRRTQLEPGSLLRCSIKSFDKQCLILTSPVLLSNDAIKVYKKDIIEDPQSPKNLNFTEGQAIIARLNRIDEDQITATTRLSDVYNYDYKYPVNLLERYLTDVETIHQKLIATGDPLAQYKIGQHVTCTVQKINNVGCCVSLSDGVQGIVAPEHWPNKPLINSVHTGVVLNINFVDRYLEISLNNRTNQKISKTQGNTKNIEVDQVIYAKILLIRTEFILCNLSQHGNRQIAYMPTALHENDFKPDFNYYRDLAGTFKFVVSSIVKGKIIGLEKNLKQSLEKKCQLQKVAERGNSDDDDDLESPSKRSRISDEPSTSTNTNGTVKEIESEDDDLEFDEMQSSAAESSDVDREDIDEIDLEDEEQEPSGEDEDVSESETSNDDDSIEVVEEEIDKDELGNVNESIEDNERELIEIGEISDEEMEESEDDFDDSGDEPEECDQIDCKSKRKGENSDVAPLRSKPIKRVSFSDVVESFPINDEEGSPPNTNHFMPPSITNFFDSDDENRQSSDDSDEEIIEESAKTKKKKLTRAEQLELLRQQEEDLRKKELEFAEPTGVPQSAEQFDRRLLAEPNSSELWTQYISFHLASTEIDKARAVIRRALQTINITALQDRLNVWIASLNLENYYGTKESFTKTFDEAVRSNDDFTIYIQAIKILATSADNSTIDEYIKKMRAKFKQEPKMYIEVGRIYYAQKRFVDARKLKDNALRTITNKAHHIPLLVQFGIMEFTLGEENHAEALFETILQSCPKRIDVWCTYIDQLVKKDKIDIARRVIERAVTQNLNIKKMKSLHKKYFEFEKNCGNDETRAQQRRILEDYTRKFGNLDE